MFRSDKNKIIPAPSLPNPADYELGSLESRAAARALLDAKLAGDQQKKFRVIVEAIGRPSDLREYPATLSLKSATCCRSFWPDGTLFELLECAGLTAAQSEQLEQLIRMVPIDGKKYKLAEVGNG